MLDQFAKDFINFQSEVSTMPKDKSGYGYKYTDLDTIITNIKPLLKKHNLGFSQLLETVDGKNGVRTVVIHTSGETLSAFVEIPEIQVGKANNAQNVGAAISYFKRYALAAVFGISSDEDVDCSTQIMERNQKQEKATPTKAEPIAPTNKSSTSKKSAETPTTLPKIKLYTEEQAVELGEVLTAVYEKDQSPIFTKEEKDSFRTMLRNGEFENAKAMAWNLLKQRTENNPIY